MKKYYHTQVFTVFVFIFFILFNHVHAQSGDSYIEIIEPNGGETYTVGDTVTIRWNHANLKAVTLKWMVSDSTGDYISNNIPIDENSNSGNYNWTIPSHLGTGAYKVSMLGYKTAGGNFSVMSNKTFIINNPDRKQPIESQWTKDAGLVREEQEINIDFLTDVSVNTGTSKVFEFGKKYGLSWSSQCQGGKVDIWLVVGKADDGTKMLVPLTPFQFNGVLIGDNIVNTYSHGLVPNNLPTINSGSYQWTVPTDIQSVQSRYVYGQLDYNYYTIWRKDNGVYKVIESREPHLVKIGPGMYKIMVDVQGTNCRSVGLSADINVGGVETIVQTGETVIPTPPTQQQSQISAPVADEVMAIRARIRDAGYSVSELERSVIAREQQRRRALNKALRDRLKSKILLQVNEKGEAWYLDGVTGQRFYLKDGNTAYVALRAFGLGISNVNLDQIPIGIEERAKDTDTDNDGLPDNLEDAIGTDKNNPDTDGDGFMDGDEVRNGYSPTTKLGPRKQFNQSLINRLEGKILLQVESRGEAWYLHNGKRYYMKDGSQAYQIMRFLSLGISNDNLNQLPVGEFE